MRFDHDELIFKALSALAEVVELSHAAPVSPTRTLRFTLAWLYAVGDGEPRHFRDFWQHVQQGRASANQPAWEQAYLRHQRAHTGLRAISRSVGYPQTPEATQQLIGRGP